MTSESTGNIGDMGTRVADDDDKSCQPTGTNDHSELRSFVASFLNRTGDAAELFNHLERAAEDDSGCLLLGARCYAEDLLDKNGVRHVVHVAVRRLQRRKPVFSGSADSVKLQSSFETQSINRNYQWTHQYTTTRFLVESTERSFETERIRFIPLAIRCLTWHNQYQVTNPYNDFTNVHYSMTASPPHPTPYQVFVVNHDSPVYTGSVHAFDGK
ncbi:hypothetical protein EV363DRAFT_1402253 [Boletus edulis]|nr:hypothetical protein EV363DRAFT_1402253 [Boletus edulis]